MVSDTTTVGNWPEMVSETDDGTPEIPPLGGAKKYYHSLECLLWGNLLNLPSINSNDFQTNPDGNLF